MIELLNVCAGVLGGVVASMVVAAVWIGVVEGYFRRG
jgi:hypothetical protein